MKQTTRRLRQLRQVRHAVIERWGERCIWPFGGPCRGHLEMMHAYSQGAHPEWRDQVWDVFPGCTYHHRLARKNFQFTPELNNALKVCADLVRSALDGEREMPTFEDLQHVIQEHVWGEKK